MPRTRSNERTQLLHDIMITALEGGVGYWSYADDVVRHENDDLWYASYVLYCWDGEMDSKTWEKTPGECGASTNDAPIPACKGHRITPDVVAHAVSVIGDTKKHPDVGMHIDYRRQVRDASFEPEDADIDASLADCIVQVGAFETVIYG